MLQPDERQHGRGNARGAGSADGRSGGHGPCLRQRWPHQTCQRDLFTSVPTLRLTRTVSATPLRMRHISSMTFQAARCCSVVPTPLDAYLCQCANFSRVKTTPELAGPCRNQPTAATPTPWATSIALILSSLPAGLRARVSGVSSCDRDSSECSWHCRVLQALERCAVSRRGAHPRRRGGGRRSRCLWGQAHPNQRT